jgi:hypothetical protein
MISACILGFKLIRSGGVHSGSTQNEVRTRKLRWERVYKEWSARSDEQYLNLLQQKNRDDHERAYQRIGVSGQEHVDYRRKESVFALRLAVPASSLRCPQCGNWDAIRLGRTDRLSRSRFPWINFLWPVERSSISANRVQPRDT